MIKNDLGTRSRPEKMGVEWTTVYDPKNPPSITIIQSIADYEDVDPTELDFHLFDYIDPEVLDTLMESDEVEVRLSIGKYEVKVVDSDVVKINV